MGEISIPILNEERRFLNGANIGSVIANSIWTNWLFKLKLNQDSKTLIIIKRFNNWKILLIIFRANRFCIKIDYSFFFIKIINKVK